MQPSSSNPFRTHAETATPQLDIRYLADYVAASRQSQRRIIRDCKYRRIARVIQHTEARTVVYSYIRNGESDPQKLLDRAEFIRNKLADDDFDTEVNEHNADYIERFSESCNLVALPKADLYPREDIAPLDINGVAVRIGHHLFLRRTTTTNKQRVGAVSLRYAKGVALEADIAEWHAAGIFGVLRAAYAEEAVEAERKLCIVLDAFAGKTHDAPGNAIYRFNEMKAACADIAERWPAIKPPKNAIL